MISKARRYLILGPAVALSAALILSCAAKSVRIGDILRNPGRYENTMVQVEGTVTKVIDVPVIRDDLYEVQDGTGQIWVRTQKRVPQPHSRVTVKGRVRSQVRFLTETYGITIEEE